MSQDLRSWQMKWQKDLETYFPVYNTFVIEGLVDDDQPFKQNPDDVNENVQYYLVPDYFDKTFSEYQNPEFRKRVIVYDPVESEDRRFKIYDPSGEEQIESETNDDGETTERTVMRYDSKMSQHFWDILNEDSLDKMLIDHRDTGVSLDLSRIHYAVTEEKRIPSDKLLQKFQEILGDLFSDSEPSGYIFVIKMASRLLGGSVTQLSEDEQLFFRQLLSIAQGIDSNKDMQHKHKLVLLVNEMKDLPVWFTSELMNPCAKNLFITKPTEENRLSFFDGLANSRAFGDRFERAYSEIRKPDGKRDDVQKKFLAYTNDFSTNMLLKYSEYLTTHPVDDPSKLGYSVSSFRVGEMTNPWDDEERIKDLLNIKAMVSQNLQGQDEALQRAQDIITRAAIGIDRAENPNAPRLVLFLAGPTGTGKTELCKQIANCVFGSEERMVRFDMSEYRAEESDQKLFGAPPGYVGYEEGGKLTNAIKKEPFSLVLFDEIEKAHNSILDKFLQIIGDGRLTDGKGDTVRFTDCIIVITSNAGVNMPTDMTAAEVEKRMHGDVKNGEEMNIDKVRQLEEQGLSQAQIYEYVKEDLRYNVKAYFYCKLGRPELYGRIEDSIVYYNYICRDAVKIIAKSKIKKVIKTMKDNLAPFGLLDITYEDSVLNAISEFCQSAQVRALGARGVIKNTGSLFSTSLANFLTKYYRGFEVVGEGANAVNVPHTPSELRGKRLVCRCGGRVTSPADLVWSVE